MNIIRELLGHQTKMNYKQEQKQTIMEKEYNIIIPESNSQMVIDSLFDILSKQSRLIDELELSKNQLNKTCLELKECNEKLLPLEKKVVEIEGELREANNLIGRYKGQIEQLNEDNRVLTAKSSDKEKFEISLRLLNEEITNLRRKIDDLSDKNQNVERESTEVKYLIELKDKELKKSEDKLKGKHEECETITKKNKDLSDENNYLSKEIKKLTEANKGFEQRVEELDSKVKEVSLQFENSSKQKHIFLINILNKICSILESEVGRIQNDWLKSYVDGILKSGTTDVPSLKQIANLRENRVHNLVSYGNTSITKLANLIWWYTWPELTNIVKEIPKIDEINFYFCHIFLPYMKTFYAVDIHMPDTTVDVNLSNYERDTITPTALTDLKMENFSIKNNTKCEISTLSYNDKHGICYVAYEIGN